MTEKEIKKKLKKAKRKVLKYEAKLEDRKRIGYKQNPQK